MEEPKDNETEQRKSITDEDEFYSRFSRADDDMVDLDDVLKKDERENRYEEIVQHKKKTHRNRRTVKLAIYAVLICVACIYMFTDLSNVKVLQVSNNLIYSKEKILKIAGLSYNTKSILKPSYFIEKNLEGDRLIESASVKKTLDGAVYITVNEQKIVGYYIENNQTYLLFASGDTYKINNEDINLMSIPYINGLTENNRLKLCKELSKLTKEQIAMISEIRNYSTKYDSEMLEMVMEDGHIIRTDYDAIKLIKSYTKILEGLNSNLKCIVLMEETNSAYSQNCD